MLEEVWTFRRESRGSPCYLAESEGLAEEETWARATTVLIVALPVNEGKMISDQMIDRNRKQSKWAKAILALAL